MLAAIKISEGLGIPAHNMLFVCAKAYRVKFRGYRECFTYTSQNARMGPRRPMDIYSGVRPAGVLDHCKHCFFAVPVGVRQELPQEESERLTSDHQVCARTFEKWLSGTHQR